MELKNIALAGGVIIVLALMFIFLFTNQGGQAIAWVAMAVIFGVAIMLFYFYMTNKPSLSPVKTLFEIWTASATVSIPNTIMNRNIYTYGDRMHGGKLIGTIMGWTTVDRYEHCGFVYEKDEKTGVSRKKLNEHGSPIYKWARYDKDVIEIEELPDGRKKPHIIHKKGEYVKWRESIFLIMPTGLLARLFGKRQIFRAPETYHSSLIGDVFVNCIAFVQAPSLGEMYLPNNLWATKVYREVMRDDVEGVTLNMFLDSMAIIADKGMNSNIDLGLGVRGKDQVLGPATPQTPGGHGGA
jgi:hypothetical protein